MGREPQVFAFIRVHSRSGRAEPQMNADGREWDRKNRYLRLSASICGGPSFFSIPSTDFRKAWATTAVPVLGAAEGAICRERLLGGSNLAGFTLLIHAPEVLLFSRNLLVHVVAGGKFIGSNEIGSNAPRVWWVHASTSALGVRPWRTISVFRILGMTNKQNSATFHKAKRTVERGNCSGQQKQGDPPTPPGDLRLHRSHSHARQDRISERPRGSSAAVLRGEEKEDGGEVKLWRVKRPCGPWEVRRDNVGPCPA